ncbi:VOC family protein [Bacillus sp. SA1-12]|uniref:VOC family protein n=1 Tax=Bacillus sp. SA1-12 TaxID=1455638 RepID=UPI000ADB9347
MLNVNNQNEAVIFWTEKVGFTVITEEKGKECDGLKLLQLRMRKQVIILHIKEAIAKMEPELNLGTPSLMFFTTDLDTLHNDLSNKQVTVGELVDMASTSI